MNPKLSGEVPRWKKGKWEPFKHRFKFCRNDLEIARRNWRRCKKVLTRRNFSDYWMSVSKKKPPWDRGWLMLLQGTNNCKERIKRYRSKPTQSRPNSMHCARLGREAPRRKRVR